MIEQKEIWKDIPEFEGYYQVSSLGKVKSVSRKIKNNSGFYISKEKLMSIGLRDGRYCSVTLTKNSIAYPFRVHLLMGISFLNYDWSDRNIVVDHINNVSTDNRLENLQVISKRINTSKDKKNKTSRFIGVSYRKHLGKYSGHIDIKGKTISLGVFTTENEAAQAYEKALLNIDSFQNPKQFRLIISNLII